MHDCKISILLIALCFAATGVTCGIVTTEVLGIPVLKTPTWQTWETPEMRLFHILYFMEWTTLLATKRCCWRQHISAHSQLLKKKASHDVLPLIEPEWSGSSWRIFYNRLLFLFLTQEVSKSVKRIKRDLREQKSDYSCWGSFFGLSFHVSSFDVCVSEKRNHGKLFHARLHVVFNNSALSQATQTKRREVLERSFPHFEVEQLQVIYILYTIGSRTVSS